MRPSLSVREAHSLLSTTKSTPTVELACCGLPNNRSVVIWWNIDPQVDFIPVLSICDSNIHLIFILLLFSNSFLKLLHSSLWIFLSLTLFCSVKLCIVDFTLRSIWNMHIDSLVQAYFHSLYFTILFQQFLFSLFLEISLKKVIFSNYEGLEMYEVVDSVILRGRGILMVAPKMIATGCSNALSSNQIPTRKWSLLGAKILRRNTPHRNINGIRPSLLSNQNKNEYCMRIGNALHLNNARDHSINAWVMNDALGLGTSR